MSSAIPCVCRVVTWKLTWGNGVRPGRPRIWGACLIDQKLVEVAAGDGRFAVPYALQALVYKIGKSVGCISSL